MTKLSININKVATIRNARGGNTPNVTKFALDCERLGVQGITVHPRPDERHIRYADVYELKPLLTEEFNIEGNPIPKFIELVNEVCPTQVTLVPDAEDAITSNAGWDIIRHADFLRQVVANFKSHGIRVSLFVDPIPEMIRKAAELGADRVELYTEAYASHYAADPAKAIEPYVKAAEVARECGLGLNAGHDLTVENAYEVFDQCRDTKATYWGFKGQPLPLEEMQRIYAHMKACGKRTVLEVVAYTEAEGLEGAQMAAACGCDILMGTCYSASIAQFCRQHGIDLLGYRYTADAQQLISDLVMKNDLPVCVAGSIDSYERLQFIKDVQPWAFTIGSAFFEHRFGLSIEEQINRVCDFIEA